MHVRSDRRYRFPVTTEQLWERLGETSDYRRWWPWLRHFEAGSLRTGEIWSCTVQPPVPYSLRFRISLEEVRAPALVVASVDGDIVGHARLETVSRGQSCEARLVSVLSPGNRYLQTVARFAAPLARFGHDWVLDTGARQFTHRAL